MIKRIKKIFYNKLALFLSGNRGIGGVIINGYCRFTKNTIFGKNNHFNGCRIYGKGKVFFGDNVHVAEGLKILTTYHNYRGNKIPYDETLIIKDVSIGDNVWIGMDVKILAGVTIGEGVIIQAGSVVVTDLPDLAIAGGAPAKCFQSRDADHYQYLKEKKEFF